MSNSEQWTIAQYHADREYLNNTALNIFLDSPAVFHDWEGGLYVQTATDPMVRGSAVHVRTLQPEIYDEQVDTVDVGSRKTKTYREAVAREPQKLWLVKGESEIVAQMAEAVLANDEAAELIDGAEIEKTHLYGLHGHKAKCRADIHKPGIVGDLKALADPTKDAWEKAMAKYGYHRQAAWYLYAFELGTKFVWPVVGPVRGRYRCVVYHIDEEEDESIQVGRDEIKVLLDELWGCREDGDWSERDQDRIVKCSLPAWYKRKEMG